MFDRKKNKIQCDTIKTGDLMAITYYVRVQAATNHGEHLQVVDLDHSKCGIEVRGAQIIENALSADQFYDTEKVNKTTAAELLLGSVNRPFTVCFEKSDGTDRTLRGRLIKPEPLLGRSMVEDLDSKDDNRLRQVDHRTIKFLIVDGVKYIVK